MKIRKKKRVAEYPAIAEGFQKKNCPTGLSMMSGRNYPLRRNLISARLAKRAKIPWDLERLWTLVELGGFEPPTF